MPETKTAETKTKDFDIRQSTTIGNDVFFPGKAVLSEKAAQSLEQAQAAKEAEAKAARQTAPAAETATEKKEE